MAIIKCKMCGGDLTIAEGATIAECEYCGSKQTIPNQDNEKKLTLFARADRLRRACEFDKAAGVYESIVADFPEEAEAYWGLVLCRYGIEYVDDPATGRKVPTCHRSSFDSILEDADFDQACENADAIARRLYRDEAKAIEDIRKGILEVSGKEAPYDIFICYKETDENGDRTIDSVIAQDVYDALTEKGYRVFFSRISLEDKLGTEYEPYIFAALNSARVMLVFGTDYEYFNAVWVKNEWSRFLSLIAAGQKKTLILCFKGIDAYDMPKEFAKLQAQDMGKVGAIQDLLRGIDKIIGGGATENCPQETVVVQSINGGASMEALLTRGNMALEDGKWTEARVFFNRVLDMDPKLALAYLGIAMAHAECRTEEDFRQCYISATWQEDNDTIRAKRYAFPELQKKFERWDLEKAEKSAKDAAAKEAAEREEREAAERAAKEAAEKAKKEAEIAAKKATERAAKGAEMKPVYAEHRKRIALAAKRICMTRSSGNLFGLRTDGMVIAAHFMGSADDERRGMGQKDIVSITACDDGVLGIKADGTVCVAGCFRFKDHYTSWTDIVAIACGYRHTILLKADGTVISEGDSEYDAHNVSNWINIVAVATSDYHTIGLRTDGTVVAVGQNRDGKCNVSDWTDIVAIAASHCHTVGLRADGTVVAVGSNYFGQCNVNDWTDIVAIAASSGHTIGLKLDGTVVATGDNGSGVCNISGWTDVVAIVTGSRVTVGLKSNGTIVQSKSNYILGPLNGKLNWKLFNSVDTIEQEIVQVKEHIREEELRATERSIRHENLLSEMKILKAKLDYLKTMNDGSFLRNLIYGGKQDKVSARLAQIEKEMKELRSAPRPGWGLWR